MPININGNIISSDSSNSGGIIQNYPNIVKSGLVLWLDAGRLTSYPATGTAWSDLTVNFYNATLVNGPSFSTAEYGGGSIKFVRASSTYASVYRVPDSQWTGGSWSVSAWVYFTSVNNDVDNAIVGHGVNTVNNGLHLGERTGKAYFGLYGNDITGAISLSAATWYNLVFTYNNSGYLKQIYVNSVFDTSGGTVAYGGTGTNTELGRYPWATNYLSNGNIAIMCFYNKVLSANEVLQNFNADRSRFGV
jgi:hypothetical protein